METVLKSQISSFLKAVGTSKRYGATADVFIYQDQDKRIAYKEYKYRKLGIDKCELMETHIKGIFEDIPRETIRKMRGWGAFPFCLVYEDETNTFCGFLMDRLPDNCYESFDLYGDGLQERYLDSFFVYAQDYSDKDLAGFVKTLQLAIRFFHRQGICLGDVLSAANTCVQKTDKGLYPYLIDVDSLMRGGIHPLGTYDSINYEPPFADLNNRTKKTDIYKLCLIVLRLFSNPDLPPERAALIYDPNDEIVKRALVRIERVFGADYTANLVKGFSEDPFERPDIERFIYLDITNSELYIAEQ